MPTLAKQKNKDGNIIGYQIKVYRGRDSSGKQLKPYTKMWRPNKKYKNEEKMESDALKDAILFENECKKGSIPIEKQTFEKYANYVIDYKEATGTKHRTIQRYRELLKRIVDSNDCGIGHIKLHELQPTDIERLIIRLGQSNQNKITGNGLSTKTILEHIRLISVILEKARVNKLVSDNIINLVEKPKHFRKEVEVFEDDEVKNILNASKNEQLKWRLALNMLLYTGVRRGELLGLKWKNINFKNGTIYLCNNLLYSKERGIFEDTLKNRKNRRISIGTIIINLLLEQKKQQEQQAIIMGEKWNEMDYVFTQANGTPMNPDSLTDWLNEFGKRQSLKHLNPHKFRHTHASTLIRNGTDIATVSRRLGHERLSTTLDLYTHLMKNSDSDVCDTIDQIYYSGTE